MISRDRGRPLDEHPVLNRIAVARCFLPAVFLRGGDVEHPSLEPQHQLAGPPVGDEWKRVEVLGHPVRRIALEISPLVVVHESGRRDLIASTPSAERAFGWIFKLPQLGRRAG